MPLTVAASRPILAVVPDVIMATGSHALISSQILVICEERHPTYQLSPGHTRQLTDWSYIPLYGSGLSLISSRRLVTSDHGTQPEATP